VKQSFERLGQLLQALARPWRVESVQQFLKYVPRVLRYVRPYWKFAAMSVAISTVFTLLGLLTPWPMKFLIDSVLGNEPLPALIAGMLGGAGESRVTLLWIIVLAQLLLHVVFNGLSAILTYVSTRLDLGMTLDFRSQMFQHVQRLSLSFHDQRRAGRLMYIINMIDSVPTNVLMTLLPLGQNIITLGGMLWITYLLDPQLALLSLTVVPVLYYSIGYYVTHIQQRLYQVRNMEGETLGIIHEAMSMLRVIVAFGREDHEYRRMRAQGERANDARMGLTMRQSYFSLGVDTMTAAGTALVLGVGAYHVLQGSLTVGELLVVMAYVGSIYGPLEALSGTVTSMQEQMVSLNMAFELLDLQPDIQDPPDAVTIPRAAGRVTFDHVDFSYQTRTDTLQDISFEAAQGQVVAIVGPTGAGKTTLISLIPRFYGNTAGRILLDGQDVEEISLKSLRDQMSLVLQEPLLFSGSIIDNIRYGRLDATTDEIMEAARSANAHDFIMGLPKKYDTDIGERGAQLSGGERQRISVARAFLKDAPILILDEPTSAIDSKTEAVILDALDRLMVGRTTFMVAHRLSTLRHADQILVMDHGRLVERGTHDELVALGGLYKQLHDMQTGRTRRKLQQALLATTPTPPEGSV
jgi:ATP-binding cassette subfamily B protein